MNKKSKPDPTVPDQPVPQPAPVLPGDPIVTPDEPEQDFPSKPRYPLEPDPMQPKPIELPDDRQE